jgi:phage gpG-like protein
VSIEISFNGSDQRVVSYIRTTGKSIVVALLREMERQMIMLRDRVVASKLSGQVLKNRTGTLRRSQNYSITQTETSITGIVATDPAASKYGVVHEYGGTFSVRAHLRQGHPVKAHSVTFPERSFLRSTLKESTPSILDALQGAVAQAIKA